MERLIEANLFGTGLIRVFSAGMVERYNNCLELLGIERTELTEFHVDGLGWSPEIAGEKENPFYLSAGPANPMAIVIGPDQRDKPIYFPFNSYDRAMMQQYFQAFEHQIADLTAGACIGLDIDPELTSYKSPLDLLMVEYIVVRTLADGVTLAARRQRELAAAIQGDGTAWANAELRRELIESAVAHGDLRFLQTEVPEMKFEIPALAHTQAFGGTFVVRTMFSDEGMAILEEPDQCEDHLAESKCFSIADPELTDRLIRKEVLELDLSWHAEHPEALESIREAMLADFLCARHPEIDLARLNAPKRKQLIAAAEHEIPETYHELQRLARRLEGSGNPNKIKLSPELRAILLRPHEKLPAAEREVVWRLIARWNPLDILKIYEVDKNYFFRIYRTWTDAKKKWAVALLTERYLSSSKRKGGSEG